jgi:hypothetical protein
VEDAEPRSNTAAAAAAAVAAAAVAAAAVAALLSLRHNYVWGAMMHAV